MKTNVHLIASIYLSICLMICGCSDVKKDDCRVFRYNESSGLSRLDPAHSSSLEAIWVVDQMYDGLVELTPDLKIMPAVAESYEVNGTVYTFKIRPGVKFKSGRQVEARDVVYSLERLRNPEVASPGISILDKVSEINDLSTLEVEIVLEEEFPPFLGLLSTTFASIIDSEFEGDLNVESAGSGPFFMKWWVKDVALVMHKSPEYWERDEEGKSLPYLEAVHVEFVPDMGSEYLGLVQGRYDFISGLHPAYMEDLMNDEGGLADKHIESLDLYRVPYVKTDYVGVVVDMDNELSSNLVRKALSLSADRATIAKVLRRNSVLSTDHFVPPSLPGASEYSVPEYDVELARTLLEEAGYSGGKITLGTTSDNKDVCVVLQHNWAEIGIEVDIDIATSVVQKDRVANSKIEMFTKSWIADYADAENFLGLFKESNFCPRGPNYTHFYSEEFEHLYSEAIAEDSDSIRWELYKRMSEIVFEEMPVIPLFHDQVTHFVSKDVEDWVVSPVNRLDLRRVKLSCANAEN